jgi:kynurenine formamidase
MPALDLSAPLPLREPVKAAYDAEPVARETMETRTWDVRLGRFRYGARVHYFTHWGMSGTYIDFPGHVVDTDEGTHAANCPLERLWRVETDVIRLRRAGGSGGIGAEALAAAAPEGPASAGLVVNALGEVRYDGIPERSVWLTREAADWIVQRGVRLLVSDVYESAETPENVFGRFFAAGVFTVCQPVNLHRLAAARVRLTALPLPFPGATQLPCRLVADWDAD